jgi:hypothetical protein
MMKKKKNFTFGAVPTPRGERSSMELKEEENCICKIRVERRFKDTIK